MGLIAGGGIELGRGEEVSAEVCPAHYGAGEIGIDERRGFEMRVGEISLAEIGVCQRGTIEVRVIKVLAGEVHTGKVVLFKPDPAEVVGLVAGSGVKLSGAWARTI